MDFNIPQHVKELLTRIDAFIEAEIKPLQAQDDNDRFFTGLEGFLFRLKIDAGTIFHGPWKFIAANDINGQA